MNRVAAVAVVCWSLGARVGSVVLQDSDLRSPAETPVLYLVPIVGANGNAVPIKRQRTLDVSVVASAPPSAAFGLVEHATACQGIAVMPYPTPGHEHPVVVDAADIASSLDSPVIVAQCGKIPWNATSIVSLYGLTNHVSDTRLADYAGLSWHRLHEYLAGRGSVLSTVRSWSPTMLLFTFATPDEVAWNMSDISGAGEAAVQLPQVAEDVQSLGDVLRAACGSGTDSRECATRLLRASKAVSIPWSLPFSVRPGPVDGDEGRGDAPWEVEWLMRTPGVGGFPFVIRSQRDVSNSMIRQAASVALRYAEENTSQAMEAANALCSTPPDVSLRVLATACPVNGMNLSSSHPQQDIPSPRRLGVGALSCASIVEASPTCTTVGDASAPHSGWSMLQCPVSTLDQAMVALRAVNMASVAWQAMPPLQLLPGIACTIRLETRSSTTSIDARDVQRTIDAVYNGMNRREHVPAGAAAVDQAEAPGHRVAGMVIGLSHQAATNMEPLRLRLGWRLAEECATAMSAGTISDLASVLRGESWRVEGQRAVWPWGAAQSGAPVPSSPLGDPTSSKVRSPSSAARCMEHPRSDSLLLQHAIFGRFSARHGLGESIRALLPPRSEMTIGAATGRSCAVFAFPSVVDDLQAGVAMAADPQCWQPRGNDAEVVRPECIQVTPPFQTAGVVDDDEESVGCVVDTLRAQHGVSPSLLPGTHGHYTHFRVRQPHLFAEGKSPGTTIFMIERFLPTVFGHMLLDTLLPLVWAAADHAVDLRQGRHDANGMCDRAVQLAVWFKDSLPQVPYREWFAGVLGPCTKLVRSLHELGDMASGIRAIAVEPLGRGSFSALLTDAQLQTADRRAQALLVMQSLLHESLMSSSLPLAIHAARLCWKHPAQQLLRDRRAIAACFSHTALGHSRERPHLGVLLVSRRGHRRWCGDEDVAGKGAGELEGGVFAAVGRGAEALAATLGSVVKSTHVELTTMETLDLYGQVAVMAAADVVVAVDGSALELALLAAKPNGCIVTVVPGIQGYKHYPDHVVTRGVRTHVAVSSRDVVLHATNDYCIRVAPGSIEAAMAECHTPQRGD